MTHELTVKDATPAYLIQAAWDKAYPLPEGRKLPAGTPYVCKRGPVERHTRITFWPNGDRFENAYSEDIRTLEPLPPVIPDDCMAVWASIQDNSSRLIWIRESGDPDAWNTAGDDGKLWHTWTDNLIDPKPVPTEES